MGSDIFFLNVDLGPFAPVFGYVSAIVGAVLAIWTLLWRNKVWETPQQIVPPTIRGILVAVIGVTMVMVWLDVAPANVNGFRPFVISLSIIAVITFLAFYALIRICSFKRVDATGVGNETVTTVIIGGLFLKESAKASKLKNNVDTDQELLKGAGYDADKLWSRASQELCRLLINICFIALVYCATTAITTVGFMIQVRLTNKPAAAVIQTKDAPGLKPKTTY